MKLLRMIPLIALLALGACSGGGGQSTPTTPGTPKTPSTPSLTVSSDHTATVPYDVLTLTLSSAPQVEDMYQVQFDISGQNMFSPSTTVSVPAIVQNGMLLVAVPPATPEAPNSATHTIGLRVTSLSRQQTSSVVTLEVQTPDISAAVRGRPTVALQLLLKALYINSNSRLKSAASTVNLTRLWDDVAALGEDTTGLDQHAEGILRGVFGVSAVESPSVTGSATRTVALESRSLIPDFFSNTFKCITSLDFRSGTREEADRCFSTALQDVSHDVIGTIENLEGKLAAIANVGISVVGRSSALGQYLTRFIAASEITEYTSIAGKAVLSLEAGDVKTPINDAVKRAFYHAITDGLDENAQALLNLVDAPDVTDAIVDKALEQRNVLLDLGDQLLQDVSGTLDDLHSRSADFDGSSKPKDGQTTVPLPGGTGSITIPDNTDPGSFCTSTPDVATGFASLGIDCTQFISAVMDPQFFHTVLEPLFADLNALLPQVTQACGAQGEFIDSPACEAALQEYQDSFDQLVQASKQYGNATCQGSYATFPSSVENTVSCIHRSLLDSPNGEHCPAGSTPAEERGIDVGDAFVCVIYSRDFIQPGSTCRQGYSLVEYLGTNRCRWDGLSTGEVAAYSLDKRTGERTTVLP